MYNRWYGNTENRNELASPSVIQRYNTIRHIQQHSHTNANAIVQRRIVPARELG